MSVNGKQKRELESMWEQAEEAGGPAIPDGTYSFKIVKAAFAMKSGSKPCFKRTLEVVAGPDDKIGETLEVNDNLETKENMGWFKSTLARLNVSVSEITMDDITNGTLAEQLVGKVFEGQAKTKGGFLNVYVNRMIEEGAGGGESEEEEEEETAGKKGKKGKAAEAEAEEEEEEEAEEEESEESEESELEAGDTVSYKDMEAEVVQVLSDEGLVRVKKEDGSIVRWKLEAVTKVEAEAEAEEGEEEEAEESEEEGEFELPAADDVEAMSAKDVKAALKQLDIDASEVKNPRAVLKSFCALAHDKSAKLELSEVSPLAAALEVSLKKGTPFKDQLKALAAAVHKKLG